MLDGDILDHLKQRKTIATSINYAHIRLHDDNSLLEAISFCNDYPKPQVM